MVTSTDMQLSVALLAGTAAAMIVSPVRRSVPRWVEAAIWIGLIVACWLAITNLNRANVRFLTESLAWGLDQVVKTSIGLMLAGVLAWTSEHRFPIANAVVILLAADILLLALVRTHRQAEELLPRILLGEWIEFPLQGIPTPVAVPYAMEELNRRAEHAAAMLVAGCLTWLVHLLSSKRDVVIPWAKARKAEAARARGVFRRAAIGGAGHALTDEQVVNLQALLSAQSIGWYGPILPAPPDLGSDGEEGREHEPDRLAS